MISRLLARKLFESSSRPGLWPTSTIFSNPSGKPLDHLDQLILRRSVHVGNDPALPGELHRFRRQIPGLQRPNRIRRHEQVRAFRCRLENLPPRFRGPAAPRLGQLSRLIPRGIDLLRLRMPKMIRVFMLANSRIEQIHIPSFYAN